MARLIFSFPDADAPIVVQALAARYSCNPTLQDVHDAIARDWKAEVRAFLRKRQVALLPQPSDVEIGE